MNRAAAATVERRVASSSDDTGSALISVEYLLASCPVRTTGDRPPWNCLSNCIDLSRKLLARKTLPCVCCRKIPALEIKATVVTRRAASLVPEMDDGAHRGTRPAFICRCVRQAIIRVLRRAAQTRSRRRVRSRGRAARSDRSPACAAAVVPARRYYDRRHLHGPGSPAEGARGKAVAAEHRETQAEARIRPWSVHPGFRWNQLGAGCAGQAASRQIGSALFPGRAGPLPGRLPADAAPPGCALEVLSDRKAS